MLRRGAGITDLLGEPGDCFHIVGRRTLGAPQIDDENHGMTGWKIILNRVKRRIRDASAVPVKFSANQRGWKTGRQGAAGDEMFGSETA